MSPPGLPSPDNPTEAHLLLETTISNCKVQLIQKSLTDQLIHRDTLQLQYSHLQVEKAMMSLTAAELHVGRVRMLLSQNGYSHDRVGTAM